MTIPLPEVALEDPSLIRRAVAGDESAFETLLRRHERAVLGLCRRMLGNNGEAEEAAQDVFFKFYRSLSRFDTDRAVEPWLFRITWNACRDRLRGRRPSVELMASDATIAPQAVPALLLAELRQAIERLPDRERAALLLREVDGLETAEVAERLGSTPVTVRTHISRARARLRGWLGGGR